VDAILGGTSAGEVIVKPAEIRNSIRNFVVTELIRGEDGQRLKDSDSLLRHEVIDSVSVLQLLAFVDRRFDVRIEFGDVTRENFDSIARLAAYVHGKLAPDREQREEMAVWERGGSTNMAMRMNPSAE
jgi:acyl carrier protein